MTENAVAISVVLPVYNGMKYLKQSVDSVLKQTLIDFEFLICDDCSTDSSYTFIKSYNDHRIQLTRNEKNLGLFPALNSLCKLATGKIIKLWAQDDVMSPECLEEVIRMHLNHPEIGFSYSDREIIDANDNVIINLHNDDTPEIISPHLHDQIAFFTGSIAGNISNVAIFKAKLKEAGWFNENMKISADFDMWVKLSAHHPVGRINKELIQLRDHSEQLSRSSKHYILHLQEDKQVYKILLQRASPEKKKHNVWVLKRTKYIYYFNLMLHMIIKKDLKSAGLFFKELSELDNISELTLRWIKKRILKTDILKNYNPLQSYFMSENQH